MSKRKSSEQEQKGEDDTGNGGNEDDEDDDGDEDYKDEQHEEYENTNLSNVNTNPWPAGLPERGDNYSVNYARSILRVNHLANSNQVFQYVTREIFKDMKFTAGDDDLERELIQLAINERYVVIGDSNIPHEAIVEEYYKEIPKSITVLRTRTINLARKKFMRKLLIVKYFFSLDLTVFLTLSGAREIDLSNSEKENGPPSILPPILSEVLLSEHYRQYIDSNGSVIPGLEEEYRVFKWFVMNILKSVNYERTKNIIKEVKDVGYKDFVSKTYTVSDEAFAILVVMNYEKRWRNQVLCPTKDRKELATNPLYSCKWTSSQKGYCKLPWKKEGVDAFNTLNIRIQQLRAKPLSGYKLEAKIKKELGEQKPSRKRARSEIIEITPTVGSALKQKLEALRKNNAC